MQPLVSQRIERGGGGGAGLKRAPGEIGEGSGFEGGDGAGTAEWPARVRKKEREGTKPQRRVFKGWGGEGKRKRRGGEEKERGNCAQPRTRSETNRCPPSRPLPRAFPPEATNARSRQERFVFEKEGGGFKGGRTRVARDFQL